jgi:hypothetical protein
VVEASQPNRFELDVYPYNCEVDEDCGADAPHCRYNGCAPCVSDEECGDPEAAACERSMCVSMQQCEGDDAHEPANDFPASAPVLSPTRTAPVHVEASVCSIPFHEVDYYRIHLDERAPLGIEVRWSDGGDFGIALHTPFGDYIGPPAPSLIHTANLPPGDYDLEVSKNRPFGVATTPYTVDVRLAECGDDLDCPTSAPRCSEGTCVLGGP